MIATVLAALALAGAALARHPPPQLQQRPAATGAVPRDHVGLPTAAAPGWRRVFADDFSGGRSDLSRWKLYWGNPGGDPAGWFDPSHVSIAGEMMTIGASREASLGGRWATGGVSTAPSLRQTYGKYLVRFRMDRGTGVSHALILWPASNAWPPEIDFSEDRGSGREGTLATVHYGADDAQVSHQQHVDLTHWHTLGVEWLPNSLTFTIDGRAWFHVSGSEVPHTPMVLAMQTQTWACGGDWAACPDATTPAQVRMDIDWVVAYAPTRAKLSAAKAAVRRGARAIRPSSTPPPSPRPG